METKTQSRKRKFKVPRGTAARAAKELKLAPSHCNRVINGKREGGSTLVEWLEREEMDYADRESDRTARDLR